MVEQIDLSFPAIKIHPDFIYNRIDLFSNNYILLHIQNDNNDYYLEVELLKKHAVLGIWMMRIPGGVFDEISHYIFRNYKEIEYLSFFNAVSDKVFVPKNFYKVVLPKSYDELSERISSKSRNNMRRKKRIAEKEYGGVSLEEYVKEDIPDEVIDSYFKLKEKSLRINYNMSTRDYLIRYHVSNVYTLNFGERLVAILLTCEQCPVVYLENLTYDMEFAKYSPGMMAYDMVLEKLIDKGKDSIFLGGGDYDYKRKYDSVETTVTEGKIYKSRLISMKYGIIDFYNKHILWKMKRVKEKLSF